MNIQETIRRILREEVTEDKNLYGEKLKPCSRNPMTGFYRDGYCRTGNNDTGSHTVCVKVTEEFLEFTNSMGNNLDMLESGDKWCLCAKRWEEANKEGVAPEMIKGSTNIKTLDIIDSVEQELDEYARTLKNARQQGVGLRFPKSAIKSNPSRFRPYNRKGIEESDPKKGTGKKPEGSGRRLYTDENPSDTVSVKFRTKEDIIDTLNKDSFKSKPHNRQSQIINLIHQRVRAAYQNAKDPETKQRLKRAYDYIESKKEQSKEKTIQLQKEGLNDKWTRGEDTVTLKQLLKITKDIPVTKMSTKKLMKHALHGDNPEEMKKVDKTSLKYPVLVLVGDKGLIKYILDGHHRIQKANKHDVKMVNVKLIKFSELPKEFKKVLGEEKEEQTEGELTEKCWAGYTQKGMKTMFGKRYPNCVKKTK